MAVRKLKPVTPGQRHKIIGTFEDITASVPEKSLVQRSLSFTVSVQPAVETTPVR